MNMYSISLKKVFFLMVVAIFSNQVAIAQTDSPCGAPELTVGEGFCTMFRAENAGMTYSDDEANGGVQSCGLNPPFVYRDSWFSFVAPPNGEVTIETARSDTSNQFTFDGGSRIIDAAMSLYEGDCSSLDEIACNDNYYGDPDITKFPGIHATGLTPGDVYYIRFWPESGAPNAYDFYDICVFSNFDEPSNDECAGATMAVVNTGADCEVVNPGTLLGATVSNQNEACSDEIIHNDVWFSFVATNTTHYILLDNIVESTSELSYSVHGGFCTNMSNISCNGNAGPLTIGNTYWVRVFSNDYLSVGTTFDLCISSPPAQPDCVTNDPAGNTACEATYICNLNGYCGTTSADYTADSWPELEDEFVFCDLTVGTASIDNNSFLQFTAGATTISFFVWVLSSQTNEGIQILLFSADSCGAGPVEGFNCWNPGFVPTVPTLISGSGLTVGEDYYIMIDGYDGDVCDYVIQAHEGIQTNLNIQSVSGESTVCLGSSIELYVNGGSGDYTWSPATDLNTSVGDTVIATPTALGNVTYLISTADTNSVCPFATGEFTVTAIDGVYSTDTVAACDTYTWIDGVTYTESNNTATHTIPGGPTIGCDSIITLNLTISTSVTGTDIQVACSPYTWIDGVTYFSSNNTATFNIIGGSAAGCDSLVTLDLTYTDAVTGTDTQVSCSEYTWIDGVTYTSSNNTATYTFVGGSVAGCDSIVTLDLTITGAITGTDTQVSCTEFTWIDGVTYTSSNNTATYTFVGGSVSGCDSIVTLDLTVLDPITGTDTQAACGSYTWIDGVTYTASNNTATFNIVGGSVSGCDSLVTLDLSITNFVTGTDFQSACESYTWMDGNTYTSSNNTATFTIIGGGGVGCDSIITLELTIYGEPYVFLGDNLTICEGDTLVLTPGYDFDSYLWDTGSDEPAINVTDPGNYSVFVIDQYGCSGSDDVDVNEFCDFTLVIPNVFTPNGDGFNDLFIIENEELISLDVLIYNRWGDLIKTWNGVDGYWDGKTTNGKDATEGVYLYVIQYGYYNGASLINKKVSGNVTLLR